MSAGVLRRAASLMRERAEAATPGPWRSRRGPGEHVVADLGAPYRVADTNNRSDRRHIASWHPAVALAIADWLDSTANDVEHVHTPVYNLTSTTIARALVVARAYLGETA